MLQSIGYKPAIMRRRWAYSAIVIKPGNTAALPVVAPCLTAIEFRKELDEFESATVERVSKDLELL